jgi:hypothetical protein
MRCGKKPRRLPVPETRRLSGILWLCGALLLFSGCVRSTMVRVPVTLAARVPVRVFPSIWVAGGNFAEDERIAERLAAHLAQDGKSEVRRVELSELEPARLSGQIPTSTAVVLIELDLREGIQQYWDTAPVQSCGYYGCSTQYQSFASTAPQITAVASVTVYEGPTARVLQREQVGRSLVSDSAESARLDVVESIAADVEKLVDTFRVNERVTLYRVDLPEVEAALRRIEAGKWVEGRTLLETAKDKLGGLKRRTQARVWYDLGMARRFAPGKSGLDQATYQAAQRAFHWAMRLDPREEYERARERLERHYRSVIDLAEQDRARRHNFEVLAPLSKAQSNEASPPETPAAPPAAPDGATAPKAPADAAPTPSAPAR